MKTFQVENNVLVVTETKTEEVSTTYSYEFLIKQKESIQKQKDDDNIKRDAELTEINLLISEAEKGGLNT